MAYPGLPATSAVINTGGQMYINPQRASHVQVDPSVYRVSYLNQPIMTQPTAGQIMVAPTSCNGGGAQYPMIADLSQAYKNPACGGQCHTCNSPSGPTSPPKQPTKRRINRCCPGCAPCCCGECDVWEDSPPNPTCCMCGTGCCGCDPYPMNDGGKPVVDQPQPQNCCACNGCQTFCCGAPCCECQPCETTQCCGGCNNPNNGCCGPNGGCCGPNGECCGPDGGSALCCGPNAGCCGPNGGCCGPNGDCCGPNGECCGPNGGCCGPDGGCCGPNGGCCGPNGDCCGPNGECCGPNGGCCGPDGGCCGPDGGCCGPNGCCGPKGCCAGCGNCCCPPPVEAAKPPVTQQVQSQCPHPIGMAPVNGPYVYRAGCNGAGFVQHPGQQVSVVPVENRFVWTGGANVQPCSNVARHVFM